MRAKLQWQCADRFVVLPRALFYCHAGDDEEKCVDVFNIFHAVVFVFRHLINREVFSR